MENNTIVLEPDVIATQVEAVQHQPHREHLHRKLGQLAKLPSAENAYQAAPSEAAESPPESAQLHEQSEMLANYYAQASEELGTEAAEEDIWRKVLDKQLEELISPDGEVDKETLATNILVASLLSVYGLDDEKTHDELRSNIWSIASYRRGVDIMRAGRENIGLCVMTGDEESPFRSINEQVQPYAGLLMATDRSVDFATTNIPVHELSDATPVQQAWYIGILGYNSNFDSLKRNLDLIEDKRALCEAMIMGYRLRAEILHGSGLDQVMSPRDVVDFALDSELNPNHSYALSKLGKEDQVHVFDRLFKEQPDNLEKYFGWTTMESFTNLGYEQLRQLMGNGFVDQHRNLNLTAFKDLPSGVLQTLQDIKLVDVGSIAQALNNFPIEDAKSFYEEIKAGKGFEIYKIFQYPEQFGFVDRDEFIQLARDTKQLHMLATYIQKYTDGSDKELISELVNADTANSIALKISEMPEFDIDWFVDLVKERKDFTALIRCLEFTDKIDQQELFDDIMMSDDAEAVLNHMIRKFDKLDTSQILQRLIDAKLYGVITLTPDDYEGETPESIFEKIKGDPIALVSIAENLYRFNFVDKGWLIDELASSGAVDSIKKVADKALQDGVDPEKIWGLVKDDPSTLLSLHIFSKEFVATIGERRLIERLIEVASLYDISFRLNNYNDPEAKRLLIDSCFAQKDKSALLSSIDNSGLPPSEMLMRCCQEGWIEPLLSRNNNPLINDKTPKEALPTPEQLLGWDMGAVMLCHPVLYPEADGDSIFKNLVSQGKRELIADIVRVNEFPKLPDEVAVSLLESGNTRLLIRRMSSFDSSVFTPSFVEKFIEAGDELYLVLYDHAGHKIDWVEKGIDAFGREASPNLLMAAREVNRQTDEPLPQELQELEVKQRGQPGIEQLKRVSARIRNELIFGASNPDELRSFVELSTRNGIAKSIAKQLTRFSSSQWGEHGEDEWLKVLNARLSAAPESRPLSEGFTPSREFTVRTIDAKEFDPTKIDEDAVNKFNSLRESLTLALEIADSPAKGRYDRIFSQARELLESESERLNGVRANLVAQNKEKAVENIDKQITSINGVRDLTSREFLIMTRDDFPKIAALKVKGMDQIVRAAAFARAIRRSPEARNLAETLRGADVDYANLVSMDDFVEHLVNNEVYRSYFGNIESRKAFIGMSDTTALRQQIVKIQSGQTSGQTTLQFIPSRGLMLELSGHVGDACWASTYESIAKEFPNITAIAYLRNPGKTTERLVGAGLVIETKDQETGEDIVVMRGTNPIENYINGVKVEDFFSGLLEYVRGVAGDRKVAIVLDGGPGQAATNRPVLYNYLKNEVKRTMAVGEPLKLPEDTTFNGYTLSQGTSHPVYYLNQPA